MTNYPELERIMKSINKNITIKGKISEVPWQHLIQSVPEYPYFEYFDLKDNYQIIIYSKEKITNKKSLLIHGKVIPVTGKPKHFNSKLDENFTEYHVLVDRWEE